MLFVAICNLIATQCHAQFLPTGAAATANIYRTGKLNIGGSAAPSATSGLFSITGNATNTFPSLSIEDGNVVFSGSGHASVPVSGTGKRLMWIPAKGAFRAGKVSSTQWNYTSIGENSVGLGFDNIASGINSVAIGYNPVSSGANSYTFGVAISATATGSMALGNNTVLDPSACDGCPTYTCVNNIPSSMMVFYDKSIPSLFVNTQGVGINRTTLDAGVDLQINGKTKTASIQIGTGTTTGYVLKADAAGNGTWSPDLTGAAYTAGSGLTLTGSSFAAQNTTALWNANKLQGNAIAATAPTSGQVLQWNSTSSVWTPTTISSGTTYTAGTGVTLSGSTINTYFTSVAGGHIINNNTGNVHFGGAAGSTSKVIIGNGIGYIATTTGAPGTYRLYVQEGILTEKLRVATLGTTAWADYVFANDYQLMPLADVENFIKEKSHLPNVPSAKEMQANGLDVVEMAAKQMEKIEELTLYIIALDKKNKELETKINSLIKNK